jgi:hypothetical protein
MTRTLRDALARLQVLVLGGALWVFALLLPILHVGATDPAGRPALLVRPLVFLPLAALFGGIVTVRRGQPSGVWLALTVPLALLPPLLGEPALLGERVYGFPAFLVTAGVLAAYLAAVARLEAAPRLAADAGGGGAARERDALRRPLRVAGAVVVLLVVALAAFGWWSAFDPALVWAGADTGEAAAARPYGRTTPALVLVVCWLAVVTLALTPLAGWLLGRTARRAAPATRPPAASGEGG